MSFHSQENIEKDNKLQGLSQQERGKWKYVREEAGGCLPEVVDKIDWFHFCIHSYLYFNKRFEKAFFKLMQ